MRPVGISSRQVLVLTVGLLVGTSTVLTSASPAKADQWWVLLVAALMAIVFCTLVWGALIERARQAQHSGTYGESFWILLAGPVLGRVAAAAYFFYFVYLAALVMRHLVTVLGLSVLPSTPTAVLILLFAAMAVWSSSQGIEGVARLAEIIIPASYAASWAVLILSFLTPGLLHLDRLLPFLDLGWRPVIHGIATAITFPFLELVALLPVLLWLPEPRDGIPMIRRGIVLAALLLSGLALRNVTALGVEEASRYVFPGLASVELVRVGRFIERIDVLALFVWVNAGFIKLAVVLLASAGCLRDLLDLQGRAEMAPLEVALGFVVAALTGGLYANNREMVEFAVNVYPVFAASFQVVLPLVLLFAGPRLRRPGKNGAPSTGRCSSWSGGSSGPAQPAGASRSAGPVPPPRREPFSPPRRPGKECVQKTRTN